jgi:demethylmenaquinone methyltransferase/2-methoxy-6-polyprenyl-1,4-benzoquinol methylase
MTRSERDRHSTYVRRLFISIATRYDLTNRILSLGQDQSWRRLAIGQLQLPAEGWLLDVATGTGDVTLEALHQLPSAHVVAMDLTAEMLERAREKARAVDGITPLLRGDALDLPFPDGYFDGVISGFLMRNVADVARALSEQVRVVRPGGRVVCLEITRPQRWPATWLFWAYFYGLVPLLGSLLTGRPEAYTYLPRSVARFLTADEVQVAMEQAGLSPVSYRLLTMNSVAIHVGVKRMAA